MQQWSRRNALALSQEQVLRRTRSELSPRSPRRASAPSQRRNGIVFGAAVGPVIDKDHAYRELYQTQTRIVTTDIAMKMRTIAP